MNQLSIAVPGLLNSQRKAESLARRLAKIPGIKRGRVNPRSGRIMVLYDPQMVKAPHLVMHLTGVPWGQQVKHQGTKTRLLKAALAQSNSKGIPWHTFSDEKVLSLVGSSKEGLANYVVEQRLKKYGLNELITKADSSFLQLLLEPLSGFMSKLLLAAAGVSFLLGETTDAIVIAVIVGLQTVTEAFQSYRAEKSLTALKELGAPVAKVLRDGKMSKIPANQLVPGDIILLEAGDRVPADARILENTNLTTNESCLTGESIPMVKSVETLTELHVATGDKDNLVFSGTNVTGGRGLAVVIGTGMQTEMGKIASLLKGVDAEPTILHRQMEALGKKITKLVVMAVGVIAAISLVQGRPILEIVRTAVSLAVGAIPEGLPAVVTVALASGVQRMAKKKAVVRRLPAVETLGSTSVICSDKTGTLTKNEMTVREIYCGGEFYTVTGQGYEPTGEIQFQGQTIIPDSVPELMEAIQVGILCNNAELKNPAPQQWEVAGDPTEAALLTVGAKSGIWWRDLQTNHCRQKEIAFDSTRKMMSVLCTDSAGNPCIYVKGAPDRVLTQCSKISCDNEIIALDDDLRQEVLLANEQMAGKALRVLATAWKKIESPSEIDLDNPDWEQDLIFTGLIGMEDPPREGVKEAIAKCHQAGIKVVMITGDHQKTAEAIADKLGILHHGMVLTGKELDQMSDEELSEKVNAAVVYSRTSPDQKLRIVHTLKKTGHIVAMTGDGVNDAPAVKEANIGIAMGLTGTDVTREAAGITLSDDNFKTIVAGVEEGRTVGDNLTKSVRYILSGSFGQVLAVFLSAVQGLPTPLLPPQILWINLVTEGLPAMALTGDAPRKDCMKKPPLRPQDRFTAESSMEIIRKGVLSGVSTYGVYAGGLALAGWSPGKARTMAFSHFIISRVFNLFDSRRGTALVEKNKLIVPAALLSSAMLAVTIYIPGLQPFFSTVPMGITDWAIIGVTSGLVSRFDTLMQKFKLPQQKQIKAPATKDRLIVPAQYLIPDGNYIKSKAITA